MHKYIVMEKCVPSQFNIKHNYYFGCETNVNFYNTAVLQPGLAGGVQVEVMCGGWGDESLGLSKLGIEPRTFRSSV